MGSTFKISVENKYLSKHTVSKVWYNNKIVSWQYRNYVRFEAFTTTECKAVFSCNQPREWCYNPAFQKLSLSTSSGQIWQVAQPHSYLYPWLAFRVLRLCPQAGQCQQCQSHVQQSIIPVLTQSMLCSLGGLRQSVIPLTTQCCLTCIFGLPSVNDPYLSCCLMAVMEAETVSKTLDYNFTLTQLIA
jgi:hypothetical protein